MSLHLGVDFGTSGCRACVIDETQAIHHWESIRLPDGHRAGRESSQSPQVWWNALLQLLRRCARSIDPGQIAAIAVDGTSGSVLLTDPHGAPLTPALMYDDSRAVREAEQIRCFCPEDSTVGNPNSGLARALWLLKQLPANTAAHVLHQADWLSNRLLGAYGHTDENNALKLGFDPVTRSWPAWMTGLGEVVSLLPAVSAAGQRLGTLGDQEVLGLGYRRDVRIIAGTTDSTAAFIATGAEQTGDAVTSLGTTLVMKILADQPVFSPVSGIYSHRLGDRWLVGGASNSGGGVLRDYFCDGEIQALSTRIDPDRPTGLDYYPLRQVGERFPINDPELAPRLQPRPGDDVLFLQGMLEGMAGIEHSAYDALSGAGAGYPQRVFSVGGGAGNPAWQRIREQRLGVPCPVAAQQEAAFGAALLALGTGLQPHQ